MNATFEVAALGEDGLLLRFAHRLDLDANAAAVQLAHHLNAANLVGVVEVSPALVSVYVRFDPFAVTFDVLEAAIRGVVETVPDSLDEEKPILLLPVCFDGGFAPQLEDVAQLVGLPTKDAVADLCAQPVRVLSLGFAPGQPYLGLLPSRWDIPRQSGLTPRVESGAVVVAARQIVVFANTAQTGWRQVGRASVRLFNADATPPAALSSGDRVQLCPISEEEFAARDPNTPLERVMA